MACNRNLVPELKHVLPEPRAGLLVRITQFGAPMFHVALVVRYVKKKAAMRISPNPFGYSSRQCDRFIGLICNTRSMVCEERQRCYDRTC